MRWETTLVVVGMATVVVCAVLAAGCRSGPSSEPLEAEPTVPVPPSMAIVVPVAPTSSTVERRTEPSAYVDQAPPSASTAGSVDSETIAGAFLDGREAWFRCVLALDRCRIDSLERFFSGSTLDRFTQVAEGWQADGLIGRASSDPSHNRHRIREINLGAESDSDAISDPARAEVVSCVVDAAMLVVPGAGPDGQDLIYDDRVVSRLESTTMVRGRDGRWRADSRRELDRWDGDGGCAP